MSWSMPYHSRKAWKGGIIFGQQIMFSRILFTSFHMNLFYHHQIFESNSLVMSNNYTHTPSLFWVNTTNLLCVETIWYVFFTYACTYVMSDWNLAYSRCVKSFVLYVKVCAFQCLWIEGGEGETERGREGGVESVNECGFFLFYFR